LAAELHADEVRAENARLKDEQLKAAESSSATKAADEALQKASEDLRLAASTKNMSEVKRLVHAEGEKDAQASRQVREQRLCLLFHYFICRYWFWQKMVSRRL
jgi:hypothetical protein